MKIEELRNAPNKKLINMLVRQGIDRIEAHDMPRDKRIKLILKLENGK